jgi:signal transduction histidine kinase
MRDHPRRRGRGVRPPSGPRGRRRRPDSAGGWVGDGGDVSGEPESVSRPEQGGARSGSDREGGEPRERRNDDDRPRGEGPWHGRGPGERRRERGGEGRWADGGWDDGPWRGGGMRGGPWHDGGRRMSPEDFHRFHRRGRRRRPWVWWIQARLRQKIFLWLGFSIMIGLFAGGYMSERGGSRGWMVMAVVVASWLGSGMIAWRLTRPLSMVVEAARAIGEGKLDTRIEVRGRGEVAILGAAINDMATRISAQLAEQRQLLAAVSHELRTPLGHLRVLLETARARGLPQPLFEQLDGEVVDLDHLVGKLLASSRLEFGQLERKPIELGELVAEAALAAGVAAEAISAERDCRAPVDPTLVRRAVANLLDNAARHGGGAVAARVKGSLDEVAIEIDDAGPGVPAERRADAFAAFVPSAAGGLGLGLALVQRIAVAHGGRAWIEDRDGGGARVGFSVAREVAQPRAAGETSKRGEERATGKG